MKVTVDYAWKSNGGADGLTIDGVTVYSRKQFDAFLDAAAIAAEAIWPTPEQQPNTTPNVRPTPNETTHK